MYSGILTLKFFQWKCKQLHQAHLEYKEQQGENITQEEREMKFSCNSVHNWMRQYRVSLKHPNKRYAVPQAMRKERIIQLLKNVWRLRFYFLQRYGVGPVIWGGDQMPLHRSEQSDRNTMNFSGIESYVKGERRLYAQPGTCYSLHPNVIRQWRANTTSTVRLQRTGPEGEAQPPARCACPVEPIRIVQTGAHAGDDKAPPSDCRTHGPCTRY